jgi:hypothetical protein
MGVFARTSRLRRHQPSFGGKHCVLVVRVDNTDRVWWCDPLAPKGTSYAGEWVTKAQLKLFVDAIWSAGGRHVVGKVRRNYYAAVKDGARLYVRSDLKPTSKDVVIKPGPRWMPYKKYVRSGVLMVEYVNAKGVHTGHNYFVKSASVAKIKATG